MKPGASYYAGGARIVIDGVPLRVARKPSDANLKFLREYEKYRVESVFTRAERAATIAKEARDTIKLYAEILEISENRAKALIAQHRAHVIANPLVDLSLEYDL